MKIKEEVNEIVVMKLLFKNIYKVIFSKIIMVDGEIVNLKEEKLIQIENNKNYFKIEVILPNAIKETGGGKSEIYNKKYEFSYSGLSYDEVKQIIKECITNE